MTDITTPAQMREAAARCCEAEADKCDDAAKWGGSKRYVSNCKAAAYAMYDRAAAIRALPVAEPERPAEGLLRGARDAVAITEVAKVISATITSFDLTWEHQSDQHRSVCMDAAVRVLGQIAQAEPEPQAVRVKPLQWHKSHMSGWDGDWHTVPTGYAIRCADENGWKWLTPLGAHGYERSPEAAQAAAEADHAARILSQIEAVSVAQVRAEALREGYDAGFSDSGEGWNGGYPVDAAQRDSYRELRAAAIRALIEKDPKGSA